MAVNFTRKTYADSYFYNNNESQMQKNNRRLINYVLNAQRIDKDSEAFQGIVEEIKRQQTSSVLYTVLMNPRVYLCIDNVELSRAFKVFQSYDIKNDKLPAIFIDCSKLVKLKDNYFVCNNIGKLVTYLMDALSYMLYNNDPVRFTSDSTITQSATESYVNMVTYILDYLRMVNYQASKDKIKYLTGLFFLNNLMGKDVDSYSKNVAAKVAGISPSLIKTYDLYIDDTIFQNINTFISTISDTFKLKGLNTEVFIHKWMFQFGEGTYFGAELFTSFSVLLSNAFCGAYVVNQKQIEKCTGKSMVQYCNQLLNLAVSMLNVRKVAENMEVHTKEAMELAEAFKLREKTNDANTRLEKADFATKAKVLQKVKATVKNYEDSKQNSKINKYINSAIANSCKAMDSFCNTGKGYELGTVEGVVKAGKKYLSEKDFGPVSPITKRLRVYPGKIEDSKAKDQTKSIAQCLAELRRAHL